MDIIQANIDRFKLLLTTEPCNGKAGVVTSQSHGSAPDEIVDRSKFSLTALPMPSGGRHCPSFAKCLPAGTSVN